MAREFGPVNVAIWSDPEWRKLPPLAQHLYLLLWTSPGLTYCGTHDWRPKRIARLSGGTGAEQVKLAGDCLSARHFIVVDEETDEVLVRSWARFDGLVKKPRMAVSYAAAYAAVASEDIRKVLAHETVKMRDLWPDLACWSDKRLSDILGHPSISAKALPLVCDPFADGLPIDNGKANLGLPSVCDPPTPAPAPAPNSLLPDVRGEEAAKESGSAGRKRPAKRIPEDWEPSESHLAYCAERGIDCGAEAQNFRHHAEANDRRLVVWSAGFSQWLGKARPDGRAGAPPPPPRLPTRDEIETPPDNLSPDEYSEWLAGAAARRRA